MRDGTLYRQINQIYRDNYQTLMDSGLYDHLIGEQLLIPHEEVAVEPAEPSNAFKVIRPEPLQFLSYPYERIIMDGTIPSYPDGMNLS